MTARIKDSDIEHLSWIYDRLANVHSENTNFDYMHKLNAIIANLKLDYAYYGDLVLHREEVRPVGELIETPEEKEALDEKTYRYEKVEDTGFFELKDEFQGRMIFFNQSATSTPDYAVAMDIIELSHHYMQKNLYRRIEVTERELFIEELENLANKFAEWKGLQRVDDLDRDFFGYLSDSGKFKFVNGKG